jgi:carbon-monoxide dehydrogenase large subunit
MRGHVSADMGAYIRTNGGVVPAKAAQFLPGPYRIRDIALTVEAFVTSKTPVGTLRAPGRFEANFFRERLLDIVAADLGLDPMDFRRKNLIKEAELPFQTGKLVPYEPETEFDTGDYHVTFERAAAEIGWDKNKADQGKPIDGRYHGLAVVPFVESGGSGKENSRLVIEGDGSVSVYVGSSVLGQGLETTLAQVAADTLRLPFEKIKILHGSTTYLKEGFGTFASRSMVVGGCAVMDGCNNLLAAIRSAAKQRLGFPNEEIEIANGEVTAGGKRARFSDFAGLEVEGTFATTIRTYSYGAHACHVAVDPRTGHVDILDYVAIEDVGVAINPHIVHGQAIGALVQGLGGVFLDQILYDADAQMLNASLADYLVPLGHRFLQCARHHHGTAPLQDQPARRQGCGRGRHGGGGGLHGQCGGGSAAAARHRGPRFAAVTRAALGACEWRWRCGTNNVRTPEGRRHSKERDVANKDLRDWIAALKQSASSRSSRAPSRRKRSAASSTSICARWAIPR